MRIAIDVDSTLHHYWDVLSEISLQRFGVDLPYEEQFTWGITRLRPDQLELCIAESHTDERILQGVPYPGVVQIVRAWSAQGHWIQIASHRSTACAPATARWLEALGVPFDELRCTQDKVGGCVQRGVELLIDDSPLNLAAAIEHGISTATIVHPWNVELCEEEDVIAARDWPELERLLAPMLSREGAGGPAANIACREQASTIV